jgi:hypothetical protein
MWVQFLWPGMPCPGDEDAGGDAAGDGVDADDVVRPADVDNVVRAAAFWLLPVAASATPAVPAAIPAATTAVMPRRTRVPVLVCDIQLAPSAAGGQPDDQSPRDSASLRGTACEKPAWRSQSTLNATGRGNGIAGRQRACDQRNGSGPESRLEARSPRRAVGEPGPRISLL